MYNLYPGYLNLGRERRDEMATVTNHHKGVYDHYSLG